MKARYAVRKKRHSTVNAAVIAAAAIALAQSGSFAPSASAEVFTTPFGTQESSGILVGPNLIMNGGGLLLLEPGQTYSGNTIINDGSVSITSASALGSGTSTIIVDGPAINGLNFQSTRGAGAGNLTVGGGITIARNLSLRGTGPTGDDAALMSVGKNTFSGSITTGTGAVARIISTWGTSTFSGPISAGSTLQFSGNGNVLVTGSIGPTSAGVTRFAGNGLLELTGTNLYSGITTLFNGFTRVSDQSNLGTNTSNTAITLQGGALEIRTDSGSFATKGLSNNGDSTMFLDHAVGSLVQNQTVTFRNLTFANNVTTTLNGRNGYGAIFNGTATTAATSQTLNNNLNGLLTFNGPFWNGGSTGIFTFSGNGDTLINGNVNSTGTSSITKNGSGTLTILASGTGSGFTGATNINAGTVAINSITALNNAATGSASRINIGSGATTGTLSFIGSGVAADYVVAKTINLSGTTGGATLQANQAVANPVVINVLDVSGSGNKTLTLGGSNTSDNEIAGAITNSTGSGGGVTSLTKNDNATWVLSGTNSYSGTTTINDGTLKLKANGATSTIIASTSNVVFSGNGGTLELVGQAGVGNVETLGRLLPNAGAATLKLTPGAGGSASLVFAGTGTTGLGLVNNVSGVNVMGAGSGSTVTLFGIPDGFVDGHITYNGGDFAIATSGTGLLDKPTYDTTPGFVTASLGTFSNGNHNLVNGAVVTGSANTARSVKISGSQTISLGGFLTINANGTNTAGGILQTGGSSTITGAGVGTGGAGNVAIRVDIGSDVLILNSPILSTSGGLTKNGAGMLILGGANSQTGATTINEGSIQLAAGTVSTLAEVNQDLTIRDGASLDVNGRSIVVNNFNNAGTIRNTSADAVTIAFSAGSSVGSINETAGMISVQKNGIGGQTLTGVSNYTGSTTITSTAIVAVTTLADGGVNSALGASSSAASNLVFNSSGSATGFNGGISYTGAASVSTDRLFTLAGNVANGGSRIQANGTNNASLIFSNTGSIVVSGSGTKILTLGGTSTGDNVMNPQIVDGTGNAIVSVFKADAGLWRLGNASNSYTGTTTIQNGMLEAVDGASLPSASPLIIGTGTGAGSAIFQSSGNFTRTLGTGPGQVALLGSGAAANPGFAASTAKFNVNLGNALWGASNFLPTSNALVLNSTTALSEVDYQSNIDLNGAMRTIQVDDNTSTVSDFATISGIISGTGPASGVIKTGTGQLNLIGSNTYQGNTEIRQSVLAVTFLGKNTGVGASSVGAWGTNAVIVSASGGSRVSLDYTGAGESSSRPILLNATGGGISAMEIRANGSGPLVLTNVVNISTGTAGSTLALAGNNGGPNEITSALADGVGPLNVVTTGGALWIMRGASTYTGRTNLNGGGTLGIGADTSGPVGAPTSGPMGVGTFFIGNVGIMAVDADRTIKNRLELGNNPAFFGDNSITLASDATVTVAASLANFLPIGKTLTIDGAVTATSPLSIAFTGAGTTVVNGLVTSSGTGSLSVQLNATGGGTLRIAGGAGPNTYVGPTTLSAGTLILDKVGAIANTGTASILNLNSGTLQATSDANGVLSNAVVLSTPATGQVGPVVAGNSTIDIQGTITNSGNSRTLTNNITGIGNELLLSGTVNLSENNTAGRTLTLGGLGTTTINGVIANGGTGNSSLRKTGTGTLNINTLAVFTGSTGILNGAVNMNANSAASLGLGTAIAVSANTVGENAQLNINGDGLITNTLTIGGTTGAVGNVAIAATGVLQVTGITYNAANNPTGSMIGGGNLSLGSTTRTFTIGDSVAASDDLTITSIITSTSTAAGLIKAGAGTLNINTPATYTGTTTVQNGTLNANFDSVDSPGLGVSLSVIANTPGQHAQANINGNVLLTSTLTLGGTATSNGNVAISSGGILGAASITYNATNNPTGSSITGGSLGLLSVGTSSLNLNRFFTVNDSTNAAVDLTVSSLIVKTGTGVPAIGLIKAGAGTMEITSTANTYTASTNITGGTLKVASLANGGVASSIGQSGSGAGSLLLTSGALEYTGSAVSTNRLFTIGNSTAGSTIRNTGSGPITFTATGAVAIATGTLARTLVLDGTNPGTNVLTPSIPASGTNGAVTLVKNGSTTWSLASPGNSYTGGTIVNAGTLLINNTSGSGTGTGPVTLNGGTVGGGGAIDGAILALGGEVSPGNSLGTLAAGSLSMSGPASFKLELDTAAAPGSQNDTLNLTGGLTLESAINGGSPLNLSELGAGAALPEGTMLPFITYFGTQTGFFSVAGNVITDEMEAFIFGLNTFQIDYNFGGNQVALKAVPEPGVVTSLLGGIVMLLGLRRRRERRSRGFPGTGKVADGNPPARNELARWLL